MSKIEHFRTQQKRKKFKGVPCQAIFEIVKNDRFPTQKHDFSQSHGLQNISKMQCFFKRQKRKKNNFSCDDGFAAAAAAVVVVVVAAVVIYAYVYISSPSKQQHCALEWVSRGSGQPIWRIFLTGPQVPPAPPIPQSGSFKYRMGVVDLLQANILAP